MRVIQNIVDILGLTSMAVVFICCWPSSVALAGPDVPAAIAVAGEQGTAVLSRSWESDEWTGDDRPFAATRASIDRLFKVTTNTEFYVDKFQRLAESNPRNGLYQFQWAYSAFCQNLKPHPIARDTTSISLALANAVQPHTYNYARLRLLFLDPQIGDKALLERLLAVDPNDPFVEGNYATVLLDARDLPDENKAVEIEQKVVYSKQDLPASCWVLAWIYASVGFLQHNDGDYRQAIFLNEQFLALTPTDDWRRASALHANIVLRRRLASGQ
jgi:tetratricopeptide (TPR) repeat protein